MNMFRATKADAISCEQQMKFVQERILSIEDNFSQLCHALSAYTRTSSKMTDANDHLALTLHEIASKETINKSTKNKMLSLAENLALISDSRQNSTCILEEKTLREISHYKLCCRNAKFDINNIYGVKQKESFKRRQFRKLNIKGMAQLSHTQKALEEHAQKFEKKKLNDTKQLFIIFIQTELAFHAETINILTKAYNDMVQIDIDADHKDFREILSTQTFKIKKIQNNTENIGKPYLGHSLASFIKSSPKYESKLSPKSVRSSSRTSAFLDSDLSYDEDKSEKTITYSDIKTIPTLH